MSHGEITELRSELERIDEELVGLIAARCRVAEAVGRAKRAAGLPVLDPAREGAVLRRVGELARRAGVEEEEVRHIFWSCIALSRRAQREER